MRELKFRAWFKEEKRMYAQKHITGIYLNQDIIGLYVFDEEGRVTDATEYNLSDVELMQYTGLKDKNGKEIYEGDIVSGWISDIEHDKLLSVGKIMFVDGAFGIFSISNNFIGDLSSCTLNKSIKIIGNVYENPELFKLK